MEGERLDGLQGDDTIRCRRWGDDSVRGGLWSGPAVRGVTATTGSTAHDWHDTLDGGNGAMTRCWVKAVWKVGTAMTLLAGGESGDDDPVRRAQWNLIRWKAALPMTIF